MCVCQVIVVHTFLNSRNSTTLPPPSTPLPYEDHVASTLRWLDETPGPTRKVTAFNGSLTVMNPFA